MKKVLIIEDEKELLEVLVSQMNEAGYEVATAMNGMAGLDEALRIHPDIILLDIVMPVMDGLTMLGKLRKDSWGQDAVVILLTNLSDNEKVAEAISHGSYDYLVKADWNIHDVVKMVKEKDWRITPGLPDSTVSDIFQVIFMALTIEEIKKIASLARIDLSVEEETRHAVTITAVLEYMKVLGEVDTAGVEPTAQVTGLSNAYREDEAGASAIKTDLIKAMPDIYADTLRVPGVFENSESHDANESQ